MNQDLQYDLQQARHIFLHSIDTGLQGDPSAQHHKRQHLKCRSLSYLISPLVQHSPTVLPFAPGVIAYGTSFVKEHTHSTTAALAPAPHQSILFKRAPWGILYTLL